MSIKMICGLCVILVSAAANADCPQSLETEKLIECITIEGSGEIYTDWLAEYNSDDSDTVVASNDDISPITGNSVTAITPAAGNKLEN